MELFAWYRFDLDNVSIVANANKTDIGTLGTKISELSDEIENIDKSPVGVYDISYEENKLYVLLHNLSTF